MAEVEKKLNRSLVKYLSNHSEFEGLKLIMSTFKEKADIEYQAIFDRVKIQEMLYKADHQCEKDKNNINCSESSTSSLNTFSLQLYITQFWEALRLRFLADYLDKAIAELFPG